MAEAIAASSARTAGEILSELIQRGYTLDVKTRTYVHDHKGGAQALTFADKLVVRGDEPLTPDLRQAVKEHRDELLAAACVLRPPVGWLQFLVGRYQEECTPLGMLAANIAAFIGLHPAHDGPRLKPILEETLR